MRVKFHYKKGKICYDTFMLPRIQKTTLIFFPCNRICRKGFYIIKTLALGIKTFHLWWSVPACRGLFIFCLRNSLRVRFQFPKAECSLIVALHHHSLTEPGVGARQWLCHSLLCDLRQVCIIFIWKRRLLILTLELLWKLNETMYVKH